MNTVWSCRARKEGVCFPSFLGPYAGVELLSRKASGEVVLRGCQQLVSDWAQAHDYTAPRPPLPGVYLIDEESLFYVDAGGQLVPSAACVLRSFPARSQAAGSPNERSALMTLVDQRRMFVLSDLGPFVIAGLLLEQSAPTRRSALLLT